MEKIGMDYADYTVFMDAMKNALHGVSFRVICVIRA